MNHLKKYEGIKWYNKGKFVDTGDDDTFEDSITLKEIDDRNKRGEKISILVKIEDWDEFCRKLDKMVIRWKSGARMGNYFPSFDREGVYIYLENNRIMHGRMPDHDIVFYEDLDLNEGVKWYNKGKFINDEDDDKWEDRDYSENNLYIYYGLPTDNYYISSEKKFRMTPLYVIGIEEDNKLIFDHRRAYSLHPTPVGKAKKGILNNKIRVCYINNHHKITCDTLNDVCKKFGIKKESIKFYK